MFYILTFLILLGLSLNQLSKKYVLNNLTYKREANKNVIEIGEEFDVVSTIENKKLLPITFLQVVENYPSELKCKSRPAEKNVLGYTSHMATMMVMPYQRIKISYKIIGSKRGCFRFSNVALSGGDMLGLSTIAENIEYPGEVVVLPKKADFENELVPYGDFNGDFSVKRWIIDDPVLTVGIKEYTGYESLKSLHWPSSLKSGRLMAKTFDYTSDNTAMVALNIECSKPFYIGVNSDKIEKSISISRSVVEEFEENSIPYGFITNAYIGSEKGGNMSAGYGAAHYSNTIEKMGRIFPAITRQFEELLIDLEKNTQRYTSFVIITPTVLDSYVDYINRLGERAMRVVLITMDSANLEQINSNISTFVERGDDK